MYISCIRPCAHIFGDGYQMLHFIHPKALCKQCQAPESADGIAVFMCCRRALVLHDHRLHDHQATHTSRAVFLSVCAYKCIWLDR